MLLHAPFFGKTLQLCLLEQKRTAKNTFAIYKEGCRGQGSARVGKFILFGGFRSGQGAGLGISRWTSSMALITSSSNTSSTEDIFSLSCSILVAPMIQLAT